MKQWSIQPDRQAALEEAFDDCSQENWDGYGAAPANELSMEWARRVLAAFPLRLGVPHIAFEPNGDAGLEWWKSPDRVLAVGVGPHGEVGYAARLDATRATGTEMFADGLSKRLIDLANELASTFCPRDGTCMAERT